MNVSYAEKFNVYQSTLGKAKLQDIGGDTLLRHILCLPGERSSAVTQTLDDIVSLYIMHKLIANVMLYFSFVYIVCNMQQFHWCSTQMCPE